ncbi:deoxyribonuclease IV [Iocasia frigidifontis]|uniref:Probable endonuclease 4 n=1 Tax=Iocasia fonsfrigidae TaxID=2682810 RepID=A0A8A7KJW3_9FIRM|nr:deoxyribonuclease IV [Iocasia fonsfrigidae]QTL98404.1 deoxyribonuclease IV [Iocasia fonsfrigidae]
MKLGKHVSIAGGLDQAPERAIKIGCNCLQIFVKNPRGWRARKIGDVELTSLRSKIRDLQIESMVVHATYLVNLASPKAELWEKSVNGLIKDYQRAGMIEADYLVFHPGSHTGKGLKWGIERIAAALNRVLNKVSNDTILLLENVAGAGTAIGSNFRELHDIIRLVNQKDRLGLCLDTCHAFAAGYDISEMNGLNRLLNDIEEHLGLDLLTVLHINDSRHPLGTNRDEHAHIGEGYIGLKGFSNIINHKLLRDRVFILETPSFQGEDLDVKTLLSLRN